MARVVVDDEVTEPDLLALRAPVRQYLGRTVHDDHELDDLVQETLLRVWEVRGRVARATAGAYAVATARNLVQSGTRARDLQARHAHRLHEPVTVDSPEVAVLQREEQVAAAQVARALRTEDRSLLAPAAADLAGERTARRRSRLARARARARVDYLLHLRRVALPTAGCRTVLEALSAGDARQQERAGAGAHLLTCPVCAACAPALLARERRLFGVVTLPLLVLWGGLRHAWDRSPRTTATAAAAAVAAAALVAAHPHPATRPAATGSAPPLVAGAVGTPVPRAGASLPSPAGPSPVPPSPVPPSPAAPAALRLSGDAAFDPVGVDDVGRTVIGRDVRVLAVPADEGFWVGLDDVHRLFVQLSGPGESPQTVRPGDRVSFTGVVQPLVPAVQDSIDARQGRAQLTAQRAFVEVPMSVLVVAPPG